MPTPPSKPRPSKQRANENPDRPITFRDLKEFEARIIEALTRALETWPSLRNAPIDDEPETEQERAAVERARQSPRERDTDHEDLRRELGL